MAGVSIERPHVCLSVKVRHLVIGYFTMQMVLPSPSLFSSRTTDMPLEDRPVGKRKTMQKKRKRNKKKRENTKRPPTHNSGGPDIGRNTLEPCIVCKCSLITLFVSWSRIAKETNYISGWLQIAVASPFGFTCVLACPQVISNAIITSWHHQSS